MATDIKLNDTTVVVEGNVGVGTTTPFRMLHVEGSEIHSGGPASGFSFADRTAGNQLRWVWYAQDATARLWNQAVGGDMVLVSALGGFEINGSLTAKTSGSFGGPPLPALHAQGYTHSSGNQAGFSFADRRTDPAKIVHDPRQGERWVWYADGARARLWSGTDRMSIHHQEGVRIEGNLQVTGAVSQASSLALKDNVAQLSTQQALAALHGLNAVTYTYKADNTQEQHVGFIAEDVPDLVAKADHTAVSSMDVVAVLTKVVQEQQRTIAELTAKVDALQGTT